MKNLFLLGVASVLLMSFSSPTSSKSPEIILGNCCSSYVWYEGQQIEMVRVCGGSGIVDYIANCNRAEELRDAMLAAIE